MFADTVSLYRYTNIYFTTALFFQCVVFNTHPSSCVIADKCYCIIRFLESLSNYMGSGTAGPWPILVAGSTHGDRATRCFTTPVKFMCSAIWWICSVSDGMRCKYSKYREHTICTTIFEAALAKEGLGTQPTNNHVEE